MNYTRNSKTKYYTKEENDRFYASLRDYKENYRFSKNVLTRESSRDIITRALLDSSLIFETNYKKYTHKVIELGEYVQVYDLNKINLKKSKDLEKIKHQYTVHVKKEESRVEVDSKREEAYRSFYNSPLFKHKEICCGTLIHQDYPIKIKRNDNQLKTIDIKNINRAKFEMQRIAKANEKEFKTFLTLTYSENEKDIEKANKHLHSFLVYIKKLKNDFKYICVPEFQKRGAVHFHLLTNINYTDFTLLSKEEIKLWSPSSKKWEIGRNIKGWNKGYNLIKDISDKSFNIVGYISKYMTKDIDNRLWGKRKYHYSRNLIKPTVSYLDINNIDEFKYLVNITSYKDVVYKKEYKNLYNENINYIEYKHIS